MNSLVVVVRLQWQQVHRAVGFLPLPNQAAAVVGGCPGAVVAGGDPQPQQCFHSCFTALPVPTPALRWLWEPDSVGVEESLALELSTQPSRCSQSL